MSRRKGDLRITGSNHPTLAKCFLILGYLLYIPSMILFVNADFNMLLLAAAAVPFVLLVAFKVFEPTVKEI